MNTIDQKEKLAKLTKREIECAACVAYGLSNADIADEMYISISTVKNHLRSIYKKLDIENRTQLAGWVHEQLR